MGNNLTVWQDRKVEAATPEKSKQLEPRALLEHRTRIVFEVRTVLSAYFQPHEEQAIKDSQLAWWCDELHDWDIEQIVWSLRKWNSDNPRLRPTPGDVKKLLIDRRGHAAAKRAEKAAEEAAKEAKDSVKPDPPSEDLIAAERAQRKASAEQILADAAKRG